jgi:poly(glycerol-phosphate) alpha-glucosyltransferase
MLDQWAINNSAWKKKVAAFLYERAALRKANCLQAFTMQEYKEIRQFGLQNPVCIIPNGVDIPQNIDSLKTTDPLWKNKIPTGQKVLLYLGRIHPKKGLTNLFHAWNNAKSYAGNRFDNWNLVIAGWDQAGYEYELKILAESLNLTSSIHFIGPQFNEKKQLAFAHADGFILPSFSEGLPMAVLEAWAHGLPVLMTKHCNLAEGFESESALEIAANSQSISEGLVEFFSLCDDSRKTMGLRGRNLVARRFNWHHIAHEMHSVYKWILGAGQKPDNIILH